MQPVRAHLPPTRFYQYDLSAPFVFKQGHDGAAEHEGTAEHQPSLPFENRVDGSPAVDGDGHIPNGADTLLVDRPTTPERVDGRAGEGSGGALEDDRATRLDIARTDPTAAAISDHAPAAAAAAAYADAASGTASADAAKSPLEPCPQTVSDSARAIMSLPWADLSDLPPMPEYYTKNDPWDVYR
jgi:hypothetical protein